MQKQRFITVVSTLYKSLQNKIIWKIMLYCSVNILLYKIFLYSITLISCLSGLWQLNRDHQMHMPVGTKTGKETNVISIWNSTKTLFFFRIMISRLFIALIMTQNGNKAILILPTQPPCTKCKLKEKHNTYQYIFYTPHS